MIKSLVVFNSKNNSLICSTSIFYTLNSFATVYLFLFLETLKETAKRIKSFLYLYISINLSEIEHVYHV